jgi:hypothetical protein
MARLGVIPTESAHKLMDGASETICAAATIGLIQTRDEQPESDSVGILDNRPANGHRHCLQADTGFIYRAEQAIRVLCAQIIEREVVNALGIGIVNGGVCMSAVRMLEGRDFQQPADAVVERRQQADLGFAGFKTVAVFAVFFGKNEVFVSWGLAEQQSGVVLGFLELDGFSSHLFGGLVGLLFSIQTRCS